MLARDGRDQARSHKTGPQRNGWNAPKRVVNHEQRRMAPGIFIGSTRAGHRGRSCGPMGPGQGAEHGHAHAELFVVAGDAKALQAGNIALVAERAKVS